MVTRSTSPCIGAALTKPRAIYSAASASTPGVIPEEIGQVVHEPAPDVFRQLRLAQPGTHAGIATPFL